MSLLPDNSIPLELWEKEILSLPNSLIDVYREELLRLGLLGDARKGSLDKRIYGGQSEIETLTHFTHRFGVNAGRPEFLFLDPKNEFENISGEIQTSFLDGKIALLDIPCGCGTATSSLVATIAKMRERNIFPQFPLEINVMGGDYSQKALELFNNLMRGISVKLEPFGITLKWDSCIWDASRSDQTANLVDKWFIQQPYADEYFVIVSNFSGAGSNKETFTMVSDAVGNILGRLHAKHSTLVWIEPNSGSSSDFVSKIVNWIKEKILWIEPIIKSASEFLVCNYRIKHPINFEELKSGLIVQSYRRR